MQRRGVIGLALGLLVGCGPPPRAQPALESVSELLARTARPLVPRAVFHGEQGVRSPTLAPRHGDRVAFVRAAAHGDCVALAEVQSDTLPRDLPGACAPELAALRWSFDETQLVWTTGGAVSGRAQLVTIPTTGGEARALTPEDGATARVAKLSSRHPDKLVAALRLPNSGTEVYEEISLTTGARRTLLGAELSAFGAVFDEELTPRLLLRHGSEGRVLIFEPRANAWRLYGELAREDVNGTRDASGVARQ